MKRSHSRVAHGLVVAAGLLSILIAACVGAARIPLTHAVLTLLHPSASPRWEALVIWRVRLPRALAAYLVGGALAASGGALQALFRNALAEPGVLGVSNGAALGAVLAIFGGLAARSPIAVPAAACLGSVAVTLGLVALTGARRASNSQSLLLAGLALANLAAAGTTLTISFALANYDVGRQVLAWLLGGLDGRTWNHVAMASAPILGGTAVLLGHASSLDAMLMGDVTAAAVGVNPRRVRLHLVLATAAMTGISVAVGGAIGFVGLLVPHVARRMVGAHHAELLPACFFGGGAFLVVADILARTVIAPEELRLGVVTAVIGSPFFLFLVMRTHQAAER